MKPFLLLQLRPEDSTTESEFKAILKHGRLDISEVVRFRIEETGIPEEIDPHDYSAIIVGGSPYDISTPAADKSAGQRRVESSFKRLFDTVITEDIPFLGCCSGNGLLGDYCGVDITRRYAEPVHGIDVTITDEGVNDPLLADFPRTFRVLVGHKEACETVPPQAVLLVTGTVCPVQMFRLGKNVYATQFHPEGDADCFVDRINTYKHKGYFPVEDAERLIAQVEAEQTPYAQEILRRFVARYRKVV